MRDDGSFGGPPAVYARVAGRGEVGRVPTSQLAQFLFLAQSALFLPSFSVLSQLSVANIAFLLFESDTLAQLLHCGFRCGVRVGLCLGTCLSSIVKNAHTDIIG